VKFSIDQKGVPTMTVAGLLFRESSNGKPETTNRDKRAGLFEIGPFGSASTGALESLNVDLLYGEDLAKRYRFWTAGATAHFGSSTGVLSGTVAGFKSGRRPMSESLVSTASGTAYYVVIDFGLDRNPEKQSVSRVLRFTAAGGSGDNPDTPRDEGYAGETTSYSTPGLFMSGLAPKFGTSTQTVGTNLHNLNVVGGEFIDRTWSPLEWVLGLLQIPASERKDRSFSVRLVTYHQTYAAFADLNRGLGSELSATSRVTGPKGLEWSLAFSRYYATPELDRTFRQLPLQVRFSVTAKF
jgi:hypothetical protein